MHPRSEPPVRIVARVAVLDDHDLLWPRRVVWAVCIAVYLTVFLGGIYAGGAELLAVGRAAAFTLVAAVLGKMALSLLPTASLPAEPSPMATQVGNFGSLGDLLTSANVAPHQDEAMAPETGER